MLGNNLSVYINYKINNKKRYIIGIAIILAHTITYTLAMFMKGYSLNFYELCLWNTGKLLPILFVHTILFLLILNQIFDITKYDIQFLVRQKAKRRLYVGITWSIVGASLLYVIASVVICFLQGIITRGVRIEWSNFLQENFREIGLEKVLSVEKLMFWILIGNLLYFIVMGQLVFLFTMVLRNRILAFFVVGIGNVFIYGCHLSKLEIIYNKSYPGMIVPQVGEKFYIYFFGWFIHLVILSVICYLCFMRTDINNVITKNSNHIIGK